MRIGIVCYPLIGGSGILATALGTELAARGHEVHFVSYARPVRLADGLPGVHFHEVRVNDYALFRYPDYTLPLAVKLAGVARAHRLDVLHVHYAVPHATAAFLAVQMLGGVGVVPKIITTLHGTDTNLLGRDPGYRPAIEHALEHSDAITTVSESLRRETLGMFALSPAAAARVEVIHNFYRPCAPARDRAAVRQELGVAEGEVLAIHLSNLRPGKRIDLLLRTFAATSLPPRGPRLLILGGADFAPYEGLLDALDLRGRVIVRDDAANVDDYLAAADVGVSTSEAESFGLSLLETLAHGHPVVAFAVGGIPELVRDGENGFLFPFGDVAALADSLDRLAASPETVRRLGEQGRRDAAERFNPDRIVERYERVYRRVLAA